MGKPKRGKKGRQDDDFGDDVDEDLALGAPDQPAVATEAAQKAAAAKRGKKGKKKKDDWEDDVADEIDALSIADQAVSNGDVSKKAKKGKAVKMEEEEEEMTPAGSGAGKSAFQMLGMDSGSPSASEEEEDIKVNSKPPPTNKKESQPETDTKDSSKKPAAKKAKGKGKKAKEEEEDIDLIMAEIESKSQPKKKGKKGEEAKKADSEEPAAEKDVDDYGGEAGLEDALSAMAAEYEEAEEKRKKKKKGKQAKVEEQKKDEEASKDAEEGDDDDEEDGDDAAAAAGSVKTAAQKKKEKKEKQKQKKLEEKNKQQSKGKVSEKKPAGDEKLTETPKADGAKLEDRSSVETEEVTGDLGDEGEEETSKKKKKDKKKKGKTEEKPEGGDKKKKSKMVLAILEQQKKLQEEEERLKREEEERIQREEEMLRLKEEKEKASKEKREKDKQRKKERIAKQKQEGTYLTAAEREKRRRAQQMLEDLKAQGVDVPTVGEKPDSAPKKRIVYSKKKKTQTAAKEAVSPTSEEAPALPSPETEKAPSTPVTPVDEAPMEVMAAEPEVENVKDEWDVSEDEAEEEEVAVAEKEKTPEAHPKEDVDEAGDMDEDEEEEDDEEEGSDGESDSDEESEESEESDDDMTAEERAKQKALARIRKRREEAEKKRTTDNLRAPVVCVLGHVDTGKTKILDKLRRTNVQDGEAGGITQQIGATNVPKDTIREQTKMIKEFTKQELRLPGLLIIDTPGHESFSNLRTRGSSLCDIAILVVDIMHGLEPQTIESINLLKKGKTPFLVALNKIDRLFQWQSNPRNDVVNTIKKQKPNTKLEFDERSQNVITQFAEQGLNAALFYDNKNPREYISLVPTSAHSGDGMGNLISLICDLTQNMLAKRVAFSEELQATVMEVKAIQGLGTTIDVILVNGSIREGEQIVVAGQEGPIVTNIRGLLMPQPLRELRVKSAYEHHKEVVAAQGCKIIAKDLDKALAGLPLYIAQDDAEAEIYKEILSRSLKDILASIKTQERGVLVQASTLGSLEALLEFLRTSKIPYANINIGPVHKRDIMKASAMLEHDDQYAVILAFDVKVEREAQEMADSLGVRIFTAEIIYHLFDSFMAYRDNIKRRKQEEFKHIAVFPCKLRVLPQYIFNSRDPIVVGVVVEAGFLKEGTPLCVPSKEMVFLGRVTSLELNHKVVDKATKGQEVCIKIENVPGETPKLYGRHFDHTDIITSKISRQSIDAVKEYFRDDMGKNDWQLMVELKKVFEII